MHGACRTMNEGVSSTTRKLNRPPLPLSCLHPPPEVLTAHRLPDRPSQLLHVLPVIDHRRVAPRHPADLDLARHFSPPVRRVIPGLRRLLGGREEGDAAFVGLRR